MVYSLRGLWKLHSAWVNGEIKRSRTTSLRPGKMRKADDPVLFERYLKAMGVMYIVFLLILAIWGFAIFF